MDIFRLNASTFVPDELIEGYSSAVWTERFLPLSEFEIRTPDIERMREELPEGSLVSHRETQEVMTVDTHTIDYDDDGTAELVVKGVSFESILQDRTVMPSGYKVTYGLPLLYQADLAGCLLIYNYLCNPHGKDLTKSTFYGNQPLDNISNVGVASYHLYGTGNKQWWLEPGEVYPQLMGWLGIDNLGLRNARPTSTFINDPMVFTKHEFDSSGYPIADSDTSKMRLVVHSGVDRAEGNPHGLTPVVFDYDRDHLVDPKYLFSERGHKNIAYVSSSIGGVHAYEDDNVSPYLSGLARKYLYLDGGDPGSTPYETFISALVQKGEAELAKHRHQSLIDVEISDTANYKYGWHYDLGDKVSLRAQYGFRPKMQVIEHTRTEDEEGDRGFPTLVLAP